MVPPTGPSFIPKQNPVKIAQRGATRQVYIFTIISYVLLIAALLAAAGVYLYDRYSKRVLSNEVQNLSTAIASFNQDDMDRVIELDERLRAAENQIKARVSLRAVLMVLENATIDTVQFSNLDLSRTTDNEIEVKANINTDSFDSVLFQRRIYEAASDIASVKVRDVKMNFAKDGDTNTTAEKSSTVNFSATFAVNDDAVRVDPVTAGVPTSPAAAVSPAPAPTSASSVPATAPTGNSNQ